MSILFFEKGVFTMNGWLQRQQKFYNKELQ